MKAHDHLAVDDVNGLLAERNQFHGVPLARRLFLVWLLDATARRPLTLREERPLACRIVVVERRLRAGACLRANGDCRSHSIEVADVVLLDLELDRAGPGAAFGTRLTVHVIQQSAVARGFRLVARRPLPGAPFELQTEMIVAETIPGAQLAEDLTRDSDRWPAIHVADNREHVQRIAV